LSPKDSQTASCQFTAILQSPRTVQHQSTGVDGHEEPWEGEQEQELHDDLRHGFIVVVFLCLMHHSQAICRFASTFAMDGP